MIFTDPFVKMDNFDPYNVLLAIAVPLKTAFVLQGHILGFHYYYWLINDSHSCLW